MDTHTYHIHTKIFLKKHEIPELNLFIEIFFWEFGQEQPITWEFCTHNLRRQRDQLRLEGRVSISVASSRHLSLGCYECMVCARDSHTVCKAIATIHLWEDPPKGMCGRGLVLSGRSGAIERKWDHCGRTLEGILDPSSFFPFSFGNEVRVFPPWTPTMV